MWVIGLMFAANMKNAPNESLTSNLCVTFLKFSLNLEVRRSYSFAGKPAEHVNADVFD